MRGVWTWLRGEAAFGTLLYRGARKMLFGAVPVDSPPRNAADMRFGLFCRMMSRYVPPQIDVAASTQPALMPQRVQSPAIVRLSNPVAPGARRWGRERGTEST